MEYCWYGTWNNIHLIIHDLDTFYNNANKIEPKSENE